MKTCTQIVLSALTALTLGTAAAADPSNGFAQGFEPHENKTFHLTRPTAQGNGYIAPGRNAPRNTANVRQRGRNLSAAVGQVGLGNSAFVGQTGNSSNVNVTQNGNNNISNVFVFNY